MYRKIPAVRQVHRGEPSSLEILDGIEKLSEFNVKFGTHFKMGFGKMWMPMGEEYVKERVYLSNLNACLDRISLYELQSDEPRKPHHIDRQEVQCAGRNIG